MMSMFLIAQLKFYFCLLIIGEGVVCETEVMWCDQQTCRTMQYNEWMNKYK